MNRSKREADLAAITAAGYHGDAEEASRIYVASGMSYAAYKEAWTLGVNAKNAGVVCGCPRCVR